MWIFTPKGHVSIVANHHDEEGHTVLVRARRKQDLEAFMGRHRPAYRIERTPTHDYEYRATVTRAVLGEMLVAQAMNLRYGNVKGETQRVSNDHQYLSVMHRVYNAALGLAENLAAHGHYEHVVGPLFPKGVHGDGKGKRR